MKKLVALPLAVLFAAACSESTAPSTSASLTPSYGKPSSGGGTVGCTACTVSDTYNFNLGSGISATGTGGSHIGTDAPIGFTADGASSNVQTAPGGEMFLGRFNTTQTRALLVLDNGYTNYSLNYDLYTIGSWDGKGKQAQSGFFEANVFSVTAVCPVGIPSKVLFASTFSNQLTVQQDFPANTALGESGGNKAATDAYATDAPTLAYRGHQDISNTPPFRSFGDVTYRMSLSGSNPCGPGNAVTFAFSSTAPGQQSNWDESWGIDNIVIKAGT